MGKYRQDFDENSFALPSLLKEIKEPKKSYLYFRNPLEFYKTAKLVFNQFKHIFGLCAVKKATVKMVPVKMVPVKMAPVEMANGKNGNGKSGNGKNGN